MGGDIFLSVSPFLFVAMSIYIYLEISRINNTLKMWELSNLMMLPLLFGILYGWIGFFNPPIESARLGIRIVLALAFGITSHVVYSYSKTIRKGGT